MNKNVVASIACAAATIAACVLSAAQPALAATSDIGKNVGDEVRTWATTLLLGVAGLVALPVLAKRDVTAGVVLALLVVLVGGFAFAPGSVKQVIESLWHHIAG